MDHYIPRIYLVVGCGKLNLELKGIGIVFFFGPGRPRHVRRATMAMQDWYSFFLAKGIV
jgi:hypothetical protein